MKNVQKDLLIPAPLRHDFICQCDVQTLSGHEMPLWNSSTDSNQYESSVEKPVAETSCQRHTKR